MPLDPTTAVLFALYGGTGAPLTGASPAFTAYDSLAGSPISQPTISEIGGGFYGFTPAASDIANGTVFVIDGSASANPRYASGALQPAGATSVPASVAQILTLVTNINNAVTGGWTLDTVANTLTLYAPDNVTVVARFSTLDASGNPSTSSVFKRLAL